MSTDFRALCDELANTLERAQKALRFEGGCSDATDRKRRALIDRARAALAEREPEEPTDEEIMELMPPEMHADLAAAACAMTEQAGTDSTRVKGLHRIILNRHAVDLVRAVLARWGRPVPQPTIKRLPDGAQVIEPEGRTLLVSAPRPIPVTERLPEAGDCKDEGWAWFFNPRVGWRQAVFPVSAGYTHWLPAHALPLPAAEVE
jgi:hypothetical protein